MSSVKFFEKEEISVYPKAAKIPLAIQGLEDFKLFLTTFNGSADLNYQVNYAFNNEAFLYVFGDKLSMFRIVGVAFPDTACKGTDMKSTPKEFIKFYEAHKLGKDSKPLRITIGGMTISGYFVNLGINLVAGQQNTFTFSFGFLGRVN